MIVQKLTLITNRKLAIAVQNLSFNLTCDATWRRNRRYVTSGFTKKRAKIAHNLETVHDRANIAINHLLESAIAFQNMSLYLTCDATWRRNRTYVTSGFITKSLKLRITRKRYLIEQKLILITNRKSAIAIQNL